MNEKSSTLHIRKTVEKLHGVFYYSHDTAGVFQYLSKSMSTILGYTRKEFCASYANFLTDDPANKAAIEYVKLGCQGKPQQPFEVSIFHKNGTVIWLQLSEFPRLDAQGKVSSIEGLALDITAQKLDQNKRHSHLLTTLEQHETKVQIYHQTLQQTGRIRKLWKDAQNTFQAEKGRYKSIIRNAFDAIIIVEMDGRIREANPAASRIFGWSARELHALDVEAIIPSLGQGVIASSCFGQTNEMKGIHREGGDICLEVIPGTIKLRQETYYAITVRDISRRKKDEMLIREHQNTLERKISQRTAELKHANDELKSYMAKLEQTNCLDELTCIYNRRGFNEGYTKEWRRAIRHSSSISVIMIDIDHFKQYNDSYGHQQGDCCLKKVSAALANTVHRTADLVCRYGGEEFVVLLPETDVDGAMSVAESLRQAVEGLNLQHQASSISAWVTISLGMAVTIPVQHEDQGNLIRKADHALYSAKESRNKTCCYSGV